MVVSLLGIRVKMGGEICQMHAQPRTEQRGAVVKLDGAEGLVFGPEGYCRCHWCGVIVIGGGWGCVSWWGSVVLAGWIGAVVDVAVQQSASLADVIL